MRILKFLFLLVLTSTAAYSRQNQNTQINVLKVQGNVYMLVGAVGNIAVQISNDGVLMVDTGPAQITDQALATVKELAKPITNQPLSYTINTHYHPEHTGVK